MRGVSTATGTTGSPRFTVFGTEAVVSKQDLAAAVRDGLCSSPKTLPPWFFYDEAGSSLFERITRLPEYYQTRTERGLLLTHAREIVGEFHAPVDLVEFGSGSASKTRVLIDTFLEVHGYLRYIPIDISRSMLITSSLALLEDYRYDTFQIDALACDYIRGLHRLDRDEGRSKLIIWLGSSVGNLEREEAAVFLGRVNGAMTSRDRLLVGIDLRKDRQILHLAYNDRQGVTAMFNLNLLTRINRELGGTFDPGLFRHAAVYDDLSGAVQMFLESRKDQTVRIRDLGRDIEFVSGERIHTENSYKYSLDEVDGLAAVSGFSVERQWIDPNRWFALNLLRPLG